MVHVLSIWKTGDKIVGWLADRLIIFFKYGVYYACLVCYEKRACN